MSQQTGTNFASRPEGLILDPSIKALTPEGIEYVLFPAGFLARTLAYAIDKIIQWLVLFILMIIYYDILYSQAGLWIVLLINFCLDWFYHVIFDVLCRGQSPGKRISGIRVVRSDGSPVDPSSSFIRNLMRFADTFMFLFPIAFFSIAASGGFKRLGDWAGNTIVVYSLMAKNTPRTSLSKLLEKYDSYVPPRKLSNDEKQAIFEFARRYFVLGEARADEIASLYAPYLKDENAKTGNVSNAVYLLGIAKKLSGEI
ncbi:MAG: RDD family protein [Treponema sp.]|nr:RDD family protein [Treponema sp.]